MNKTQTSSKAETPGKPSESNNPDVTKNMAKRLPEPQKPDIFNDDNAYKEYLRYKEEEEKKKKDRIDKVLDDYTYVQLNLPSSNYRSQFSDLIYRPAKYPVNIVHPARDNYTQQYIGFNQQSSMEVFRRNKQMQPIPQQYIYQPQQQQQQPQPLPPQQMHMQSQNQQQNPFQYAAGQQLGGFQQASSMMPGLGLNQGNLFYQQQSFGHPIQNQNYATEQYSIGNERAINQIRKNQFLVKSNILERKQDYAIRSALNDYQY